MEDDLLTVLRTSKIFSSINRRAINRLLPRFDKIELEKNDILYQQGDPSDSLEIVLSGQLASYLTTATGESKLVGTIGPGETVGELGALSGEPRPTTIKATQNSILFKLPSELFIEICQSYPAVLFALIKPMITRSHQIFQSLSSEKFKKHIVIIPANTSVNVESFIQKLEEQLIGLTSVIVISDFNDALLTKEKIDAIFEEIKQKNIKKIKQKLIYIIKPYKTHFSEYSFEKIDMLYLLTNADSPKYIDEYVGNKIEEAHLKKIKVEIIITHDKKTSLPTNTLEWLALSRFNLHHHVRMDRNEDFDRLIRFMRSKPVGIVLGGGGTRGWAHVGALKAISEAGIPIDLIGGASVGAIVAASYAMSLSIEQTLALYKEVIDGSRGSVSWRSLTWPAISLFNAKSVTHILQSLFKDIQIEDLWIPYFCVSTDLSNNSETIHRTGSLWEQVRASIAIPGIIPPMVWNGKMHFDGGLLNNLPVDIMRNIVGLRGTILAVELSISNEDTKRYHFPPVLTFWKTFMAKIGFANDYKFPGLIDTFLKSLLVGSFAKAQQNGLSANLLISLNLSGFPMLHSNRKLENRILDIGYESTMQQIRNMKISKST